MDVNMIKEFLDSNKSVGANVEVKYFEDFFKVVTYVNNKFEIGSLNGFGLDEFKVDKTLASFIYPESIKLKQAFGYTELLTKVTTVSLDPKVTPDSFMRAQEYILSRFKKNPDFDKTLKTCRARVTFDLEFMSSVITTKGIIYGEGSSRLYPLKVESFVEDYAYDFLFDGIHDDAWIDQVERNVVRNIFKSVL